jgi:hypothetical protein
MGGPVNAANTAYAHKWKGSPQAVTLPIEHSFHMEGHNEIPSILDVQRLTLVWEEYEGKSRSVCGQHNIFQNEKGINPEPLKTASLLDPKSADAPSWIMYDPKDSAISYDCQDFGAVRTSRSKPSPTTCSTFWQNLESPQFTQST